MKRTGVLAALNILIAAFVLVPPARAGSQLNYAPAKRAMQAKADRVAGKRTKITAVFRLKPAVYSGRAEWTEVDPTGCKGCGYDPNTGDFYDTPLEEACSLSMVARKLTASGIRVRIEDSVCF